jgi:hypothetical protein
VYSIAKVDVDVMMDDALLERFIATRVAMLEYLGYTLVKVNYRKTAKGYHFWFWLKEALSDKELCDLQFLLGDDHKRCRFNYMRYEMGSFRPFNVLFSVKAMRESIDMYRVSRGDYW